MVLQTSGNVATEATSCGLSTILTCADLIFSQPSALATIAASLLGALITVIGLLFVWIQIRTTRRIHEEERRWKRSEFVRSLLSEMTSDRNIALITRILDWREGPAPIPPTFQPLFDQIRSGKTRKAWDSPIAAPTFFEINWQRFIESLEVVRNDKHPDADWRNPDRIMYRTCFDSFCSFVQGLAEDVRSVRVQPSEYADLGYFCHRIIFPLDANRDPAPEAAAKLKKFILDYYNRKTYRIILIQAEVYALTHEGEAKPSDHFDEWDVNYPTRKTLEKLEPPQPFRRRMGRLFARIGQRLRPPVESAPA